MAALLCGTNFCSAAPNELFAQGVALDQVGQFPEAAVAFENSMRQEPSSGALVNLGIVEWQRGHAGPAILAWERARWIDPLDARANANLKFARQVAQLDDPQLNWFEAASVWLPPEAWMWISGASLWLTVGALVLPGIFRRRKAGWHQALAAFGFCIFLFGVTADFGVVSRTQIGFVVKKSAPLLLTPTTEGEELATLNTGEPARKLRERGNYFFIRTALAKGWIRRDEFGLICPER